VCAVGGGGKTSLLERLAREYEAEDSLVVLTTTTHVRAADFGGRPLVIVDSPDDVERLREFPGGVSPVVGRSLDEAGKLVGVPPEWLCLLRDLPWAAAVLVEADGAKGLPLKAPAEWEPVLPECASLVVGLAGLDAQGTLLDDVHVHRADRLAALLELPRGAPVPPARLLDALLAAYGRSLPGQAGLLVAFNKADLRPPEAGLVQAAVTARVETWAGSVAPRVAEIRSDGLYEDGRWRRLDSRDARPDVLVLAAGIATRMGADKLLAWLGDGTVLGAVVRAATGCAGLGRVVVVTGPDSSAATAALRNDCPTGGYEVVGNPSPEAGMASSLQVGVTRLAGGRDLLVLLGDQPLVTKETLSRLLAARAGSPRAAAVALAYAGDTGRAAGGVGPPVLLHRSLRPQLLELRGDQGARLLLARYADAVTGVACEADEALDVDTPADLALAREIAARRKG
jgi:probable selenium-dependent hydroxylase accessory protein YqeC